MPTRIPIKCSGETHYITVTDDYELEIDTEKHDLELELALGAIGGEMSECVKLFDSPMPALGQLASYSDALSSEQRLSIANMLPDDWKGNIANHAPGLSPEQRLTLAYEGLGVSRGELALHEPDLDIDDRFSLAMSSDSKYYMYEVSQMYSDELTNDQFEKLRRKRCLIP